MNIQLTETKAMLTLKFPDPVLYETELANKTLLDLPPQTMPAVSQSGHVMLQMLRKKLEQRTGQLTSAICHPHRIFDQQYISLYLTGTSGAIDILIAINGKTTLSATGPRWHIDTADPADAWYLTLWLIQEGNLPHLFGIR